MDQGAYETHVAGDQPCCTICDQCELYAEDAASSKGLYINTLMVFIDTFRVFVNSALLVCQECL